MRKLGVGMMALGLLTYQIDAQAQGAGKSLDYDGGDDHLVIPYSASLDIIGAITVEVWMKPTSFHSSWNYLVFWTSYKIEFGFYGTDAKPRFKPRNEGGSTFEVSASALTAGQWHHIAAVRNGSFVGIYVDGVLKNSRNDFTGDLKSTGNVKIGGKSSSGFTGTIDEVRIWDTALDSTQIRAQMCLKLAGTEWGLAAGWRFDEGTGQTVADLTANNNDGTLGASSSSGADDPVWSTSGAPLGDASTNAYTGSWSGVTVTLAHADGDSVRAGAMAGSPNGVHVYCVDEAPNVTTPPAGFYNLDPLRYWGIFVAGGTSPTFTVTYYYEGHMGIGNESTLKLAKRDNNADTTWADATATLDQGANTLTKMNESSAEYILGSTSPDNALPVQLTSFAASVADGKVILYWRTESELDNLGFNIHRAPSPNGPFVRINDEIVPGAGTSPIPHEYNFIDANVMADYSYFYFLEHIGLDGTEGQSQIIEVLVPQSPPQEFALFNCRPNPFNVSTVLSFQLPVASFVRLEVYDISGRLVGAQHVSKTPLAATPLLNGWMAAGAHAVTFDGSGLASGIYVARLQAGEFATSRKMVLLK